MNLINRRRVRNILFRVHTWIGLYLCLLLAIIFATGTLLLFSPELRFFNRPDLWIAGTPADAELVTPGQIYDSVLSEQQDGSIGIIASAPRPWFGRAIYGSGPDGGFIAHVDPTTAEIIGYGTGSFLRGVIRSAHDSLLIPISFANVAVNFLSFVVLTLVTTGLITYRRFWKGYLRLPSASTDTRTRRGALHRLIGIWVAPFLIVSALGSSVFFANAIGWKAVTPSPTNLPERVDRLPDGFAGADLDALILMCRKQVPAFKDTVVVMPDHKLSSITINGYDTNIGEIFGKAACHADPFSGEVLDFIRTSEGNAMANIKSLAIAVHYGAWAGWISFSLWVAGGIGSLFLVLTGTQVYASRAWPTRSQSGSKCLRQGTLPRLIKGLGIFKWGYLLLATGMCAMVLVKALS